MYNQSTACSKKLEQDLKLKEIKPRIVNRHSVGYCFKCDLCDSNYVGYTTSHWFVSTHCWSSIFCHWSRSERCHGHIDLLNESQFRMLQKCSTKWDCLVYEIRTIRPNLNTRATPLGPNYLLNFQCLLIYSSLHHIYSISLFYFHLIMTFWKRRAMFCNVLSQNFIVKCFTKSLVIRKRLLMVLCGLYETYKLCCSSKRPILSETPSA